MIEGDVATLRTTKDLFQMELHAYTITQLLKRNRAGYGQRSAVATVVLPRLRGDVLHLPFLLSGGRSTAGMSAAAGCGANRGGGPTAATSRTRRFGPIIANASGNTGNGATGDAGIFASLPFHPMFSGVPNVDYVLSGANTCRSICPRSVARQVPLVGS